MAYLGYKPSFGQDHQCLGRPPEYYSEVLTTKPQHLATPVSLIRQISQIYCWKI